jgi:IclR family transcriptional regulator, acetate operon repressor
MPKRLPSRNDAKPQTNPTGRDRYFSRSIGHALNILEIFNRSSSPLSLSEITRETRLPKSSVFRILHTLEVAQYLKREGRDTYVLSPVAAARVPNGQAHNLAQIALPFARELNREVRATVSVAYLFENHIEVVLALASPEKVQMSNVQGSIIPPHASSLGKSIVAFQPEAYRDRLLATYGITRFTPKTITREAEIDKDYELVRRKGYATDMEETALGGNCFAAPIRDRQKVIAAISVSVPIMKCDNRETFINAVVASAKAISAKLNGAER